MFSTVYFSTVKSSTLKKSLHRVMIYQDSKNKINITGAKYHVDILINLKTKIRCVFLDMDINVKIVAFTYFPYGFCNFSML